MHNIRALVGLLALFSFGCGKVEKKECPSGPGGETYFCLADQICAPEDTPIGCYPKGSTVEACAGESWDDGAEPEECRLEEDGPLGYCYGKVCLISGCGDGLIFEADGEECDPAAPPEGDEYVEFSRGGWILKSLLDDDGELRDEARTFSPGDYCSLDCRSNGVCGNGKRDDAVGEVCDNAGGEGCSADCRSTETCGNGLVDSAAGEECDRALDEDFVEFKYGGWIHTRLLNEDGELSDPARRFVPGDYCSSDCRSEGICGDGVTEAAVGEACDNGNTAGGDGCSANCRSAETCGNGIEDPDEVCDFGSVTDPESPYTKDKFGNWILKSLAVEVDGAIIIDTDRTFAAGEYCRADCRSDGVCGNSEIDQALGEACDFGDTEDGGGCSANCRSAELCGNGALDREVGEVCDPGLVTGPESPWVKDEFGNWILKELVRKVGDRYELIDPERTFAADEYCRADCRSDGVCGNSEIDPALGEVCDYGDTEPGGGCSANCRSTEACGNGIWDREVEPCDFSANDPGSPKDCSRICTITRARWEEWRSPLVGAAASMTYHGGPLQLDERGRCEDGSLCLSDGECAQGTCGAGPEMLLLSGMHPLHGFAMLWRFVDDERGWSRIPMANGPPTVGSLLAYPDANEPGRWHTMALSSDGLETWIVDWAARRWTRLPTDPVLEAYGFSFPTLAFDAGRKVPVTIGREALVEGEPAKAARVLRFDIDASGVAGSWSLVTTETPADQAPAGDRSGYGLAYDTQSSLLMLYGGGASPRKKDLWSFDAQGQWAKLASPGDSSSWNGHSKTVLVPAPDEGRLYVLGTRWSEARARELHYYQTTTGTWDLCGLADNWDGAAFGARAEIGGAFDALRGRVLLSGGTAAITRVSSGTFAVDDCQGTSIADEEHPPFQGFVSLGLSEREQELILHTSDHSFTDSSGDSMSVTGDETWAFDGVAWEKLAAGSGPPPRSKHTMATHPIEGEAVLYGGESGNTRYNDLWAWRDNQWVELEGASTDGRPAGRNLSLERDPTRGVLVTYGGPYTDNASGELSAFWTWDPSAPEGSRWQESTSHTQLNADDEPTTGPPKRAAPVLATDGEHFLMFGGRANTTVMSTLFAFHWGEGEESTYLIGMRDTPDSDARPQRVLQSFTYNPDQGEYVVFGGSGNPEADVTYTLRVTAGEPRPEATWTSISTAELSRRINTSTEYLPGYGVVLFGGQTHPNVDPNRTPFDDTWVYRPRFSVGEAENCWTTDEDEDADGYAGCADVDCLRRRCGVVDGVGQFCLPDLSDPDVTTCRAY